MKGEVVKVRDPGRRGTPPPNKRQIGKIEILMEFWVYEPKKGHYI